MKEKKIKFFCIFSASALLIFSLKAFFPETAFAASYLEGGGFKSFFAVFLLGLALNLTPCVYPMLGVTVSIFSGSRRLSRLKAFSRALVYVLGIAFMYSALGTAAAFTGGLLGGILQSRVLILLIALLFIILSLSMLGFYEIRPPAALLSFSGTRKTFGYGALFLSGLFVGIFAAPCIGPPVVGLMAVAGRRGDPFWGFAVFFALSLGLGFPYLILGTFSGLLSRLPRSGEWMIWFRKLLGIGMAGVGIFYFSLLFNPDLVFLLVPAALAAGGVYLGFFEKSESSFSFFIWIKRGAGLLLMIMAFLLYNLGRAPSVEWQDYAHIDKALLTEGEKPSLLYFSADWCIPCLEMDRRTFTDEGVREKLSAFNLFKADLSSYESSSSRELREKYDILGVPTIIFFDKSGREIPGGRQVGFLSALELSEVIEGLEVKSPSKFKANDDGEKKEYTEIRLISDVQWVRPGRPFKAGILFLIQQDWYVYWINPGDSGASPEYEWFLPENFTAGPVQWPAPRRFETGPFANFGHKEKLLLSREIKPPSELEPGEVINIKVNSSWLVCKDICVGEEGEAELSLPVKDSPPPPDGEWQQLFEKTEKMVPRKNPYWKFRAEIQKPHMILYLTPPPGTPSLAVEESTLFPLNAGLLRTDRGKWERKNGGYVKKKQLEGPLSEEEVFKAVMVFPQISDFNLRPLLLESEIKSDKIIK